jgi:hypothetical protein
MPAPPVIALLASRSWSWSSLPPTSLLPVDLSVLDFYTDVVSAKMEAGGWSGELGEHHVEYILASLLHSGGSALSHILRFVKEASSGPVVICAAITNIDSISNQQLQCLSYHQQLNIDEIAYWIYTLCIWEGNDRLVVDFWLKYLLLVYPCWKPVIPFDFHTWLSHSIYPIDSRLFNQLSQLCAVMENSAYQHDRLLSVVQDLLNKSECIDSYSESLLRYGHPACLEEALGERSSELHVTFTGDKNG